MTLAAETDRLANAKAEGQAQFDSIREMVEELERAESGDNNWKDAEEARERILEDALSVEIRSGWYVPGSRDADTRPAEYRILLCTGGPAVQIVGTLSEYGEPVTTVMQVQDWFTPWTDFEPHFVGGHYTTDADSVRDTLLAYARCFYFGE